MNKSILLAITLTLAFATPLTTGTPPGPGGQYEGPGTIVTALEDRDTGASLVLADNGAVVCTDTDYRNGTAAGNGGLCIPFGHLGGDSIQVTDEAYGDQVAFQVCVDHSGDGVCTANAGGGNGTCTDRVIFSHDSRWGAFLNPLYLPPWLAAGFDACDTGGFPGYIVILCAGVHRDFGDTAAHTHDVTRGTVTDVTTGGGESGDFCGGPVANKAYVVL